MTRLPTPRGERGELLTDVLRDPGRPGARAALRALADTPVTTGDPAAPDGADEDAALCLWLLHELHYRGFDDVDDRWEWDPDLIAVRGALEADLEARLRARWEQARPAFPDPTDLFALVEAHDGASVAAYVRRDADRDQVLELLRIRSVYHLKEADPTAWVVPRLGTAAKAALVELQYDEYGGGDPARLHAGLWEQGMAACGLDASYAAYVDEAPVSVLEQNNALSLFGLHRRLRGAALGHLAAFEATSSLPSRKMAQGLERVGLPAEMVDYYTEHVEADAVHEQLAVRTICGSLLQESPELADDVAFGAWTCLDLEDRFARWLLERWQPSEVAA